MLQWSKEEDEVLAQVMPTTLFAVTTGLTLVLRLLQSTVRNGIKCKKLCPSGDITKSDNDG